MTDPGSAFRALIALDQLIALDTEAIIVTAEHTNQLLAFADHGPAGGGEPLAGLLRRGGANANTAADHITVLDLALAQLPDPDRSRVLVRADCGGGTKAFLARITALGLGFSVGFTITDPRPGAGRRADRVTGRDDDRRRVAVWNAADRPPGTSLPGAQLRITDADGWRLTVFATNTARGNLAELEVRHRLRARAKDRIRALRDTGLWNLPLHDFEQNQIWLETVLLAAELTAWTQTLALTDQPARRREPKRLRLRLFAVAGRLVRTARRAPTPRLALGNPDRRPALTLDPAPTTGPDNQRPER